jgi:hypothetical protein
MELIVFVMAVMKNDKYEKEGRSEGGHPANSTARF